MNKNYKRGIVNGLKYKLYITPNYRQKFAAMVSLFGSKDEVGSNYNYHRGIAHFIEHKLLVTKDLEDGYKILTDMGVYANAATANNHTYFEISGLEIFKPLRFLINAYFNPTFDSEDLEKEKKVIIRELNMVNDRPGTRLFYKMMKAYFNNEPISNPIIGSEESVNAITKEEMYDCYNRFYKPSNSELIVVGDILEEDLIKLLEEVVPKKEEALVIKNNEYSLPKSTLITDTDNISIPKFFLDIRFNKKYLTTFEKVSLSAYLDQLFGEYSNSFKDLFKKRLINKSFYLSPYSGIGYNGISIDSESFKPLSSLQEIIKLLNHKPIIDEELAAIFLKRYKASTIRLLDSNNQVFYKMIEFSANGLDLFEFIDEIIKIDKIDWNIGYKLLSEGIYIKGILKKS